MRTYGIEYLSNQFNVLRVPADWQEPHVLYLFERNEKARSVPITVPTPGVGCVSLASLVVHYSELLTAAGVDIFAVRYLPEGIGVLKRSKYFTDYQNEFHGIRAGIFAGAELDAERIDGAFERFGTLLRPGRFAKLLGCSDLECEEFSRAYLAAFAPIDEEALNEYEFKLLTGPSMLRAFKSRFYPASNSSSLFSACMVNRLAFIDWYKHQRGKIAAAVVTKKSDGRIYARAVTWMDATIKDGSEVLHAGKIADRAYFYSDRHRDILNFYLRRDGIPYKLETNSSTTDASFLLPGGGVACGVVQANLLPNNGAVRGFPFLDTLEVVAECKGSAVACNDSSRVVGDVYRQRSTQGGRESLGRLVRVTVGEYAGRIFAARVCQSVLLPDGAVEYTRGSFSDLQRFGNLSPMYCNSGRVDSVGGEYVPDGFTAVYSVGIQSGWDSDIVTAVDVRCFPHQLTYDRDLGRWVVRTLWDSARGQWLPVECFRLRNGQVAAV